MTLIISCSLQAERKGATASEYGFVFGIFEFTVFVTSPIFGKYVRNRNRCGFIRSPISAVRLKIGFVNEHFYRCR